MGGQFAPEYGGQFGSDLGGQFTSESGGQFNWIFQGIAQIEIFIMVWAQKEHLFPLPLRYCTGRKFYYELISKKPPVNHNL